MYEEIEKLNWGHKLNWGKSKSYNANLIWIDPGKIIGLRYSKTSDLDLYVMAGELKIWRSSEENDFLNIEPGGFYHIDPRQLYRFKSPEDQKFPTAVIMVDTNIEKDIVIVENIN